MASLANKHLSEAALGRYGDTEMYKTSPSGPGKGREWHVNKEEKSLMNMYGLEGEKLVDAVGSGTINPYTGKEEKFLMAAAAIGSLALSGYQSWKSGSTQEKAAKSKVSTAESGIASTEEAQQKLEESIEAKKEVFQLEFEKANQDLSRQAGYAFDKTREQYDSLAAKTGMATSGAVVRSEEKSRERLGAETKSKTEDLIANLGRNMGSVMEEYESEKARLKSEKEKFERELGLAQEQSDSWYLGKKMVEFDKKSGINLYGRLGQLGT
jgi:outer membrane murein-binding lipoprotein Lpp